MATCDAEALLASGAPFQGLGNLDLKRAETQLLVDILLALDPTADTTPETLIERATAFQGLSNRDLQIAEAQLMCEWLNA